MGLGIKPFDKGITELADGAFAWLAPDGSWGWSNAGLIVSGDQSMVVDTLFDLALTREMLDAMHGVAPAATRHVDVLVNTHANGDHCHGNELVPTDRIIASVAAAEEIQERNSLALYATGAISDDSVIDPRDTRTVLAICLSVCRSAELKGAEGYGVFRL